MGRWDHVPRFMPGDQVEHPDGRRGVVVLSYPSKKPEHKGKQWPIVRVLDGGNTREWPSRGWRVDLNRGHGLRLRCSECERPFDASAHVSLCAQCKRQQDGETATREALERQELPEHVGRDALRAPWRLRDG